MNELYPLRGFIFNKKKVDIRKTLIRQEIFTPDFVKGTLLYPFLFEDESDSRKVFEGWIRKGIVEKLNEPGFILHLQEFELGGRLLKRIGIIGLLRVTPFDKRAVFPHERTFREPTLLHLGLMEKTGMNFDQVLMLYEDKENLIKKCAYNKSSELLFQFKDHLESQHTIFWNSSDKLKELLSSTLSDEKLVIADGHHRYEASILYKMKMESVYGKKEEAPWNFRMVNLINAADEDVVILPTHRYVPEIDEDELHKKLTKFFIMEKFEEKIFEEKLEKAGDAVIGLVLPSGTYIILPKDKKVFTRISSYSDEFKELGVVLLHSIIFPMLKIKKANIMYFRSLREVFYRVSKDGGAAFCLKPMSPSKVRDMALKGQLLPPKSTDFYPKLVVGLFFYNLINS